MPMSVFTNTLQRFLRDRHARLATVPLQHGMLRHDTRDEKASVSPLLLTGLIAALYVAVRIGVTYAIIGH